MTKTLRSSAILIASLWVGILFCLGFVVAPYLFILGARKSPLVPHSGAAADLIGPLLYGSDVLGLIVGTGLIATLIYLRTRDQVPMAARMYLTEIGLGLAILCAAANYWIFTPRVKLIQGQLAERFGAFHLADRADPLYRQFDGLHQTSTTLFLMGFAAALVGLICMTQFRTRSTTAGMA